jgi:hypothetical protein
MIEKSLQEVCCFFKKAITFLQENFWHLVEASRGDGCMKCSYKDPGNDEVKKLFNNAWHEVRTGKLALGFPSWVITRENYHSLRKFLCWPIMHPLGCITSS